MLIFFTLFLLINIWTSYVPVGMLCCMITASFESSDKEVIEVGIKDGKLKFFS